MTTATTKAKDTDDVLVLTEVARPRRRLGWAHLAGAIVGAALGAAAAMALAALLDDDAPAPVAIRAAAEPAAAGLLREARKAAIEHRFADAERLIGEAERSAGATVPALDEIRRFVDIIRARIDFG